MADHPGTVACEVATLCPCGGRPSRHPGWGAPHDYGPLCCRCCVNAGAVTLKSMFRYGLRSARAEFLTADELARVDTAELEELAALATAANLRMALASTTRFSS